MAKEKFTVKQGLAVQAKNLAVWKKLLKKQVYAAVKRRVDYENANSCPRDGYDVFRGSDITNLVQNIGAAIFRQYC
jgi:hypothetical protein